MDERKKAGDKNGLNVEKIDLNLEDLDSDLEQTGQKGKKLIIEDTPDHPARQQITISKEDLPPDWGGRQTARVNWQPAPTTLRTNKKPFKTAALVAIPTLLLLVAAGIYFSIGGGEDYVLEIVDPAEELQEMLDLTDQQLQAIQKGTGTVQFTEAQVEIYREPVEEMLEYLIAKGEINPEEEETLLRLLNDGEADLQKLNSLAGSLLTMEDETEPVISAQLYKLPDAQTDNFDIIKMNTENRASVRPLLNIQPSSAEAAANPNYITLTTLYTPHESKKGDAKYSLKSESGYKYPKISKPNYVASATAVTGNVFAVTSSWIGSDRSAAMVGITFDVPQDQTAVEITSTVQHVSGHIGAGLGINFAGAWLPVYFDYDYKPRFETVMNPFTIEKGLELVVVVVGAAFGPAVKVPIMLKAAKDIV